MEKLLRKLKSNSTITMILSFLSLTWIVIDYFVLRQIFVQNNLEFGFDWALLMGSGIIFLLFHIWVIILLFVIMRVQFKFRSEKKKAAKVQESETKMIEVSNPEIEE